MNKLYTADEVKDMLGIKKVDTIYRYLQEGKLKGNKLGGNGKSKRHWRIKEKDLDDFISGQTATEAEGTGEQAIEHSPDADPAKVADKGVGAGA